MRNIIVHEMNLEEFVYETKINIMAIENLLERQERDFCIKTVLLVLECFKKEIEEFEEYIKIAPKHEE